MSDVRILMGSDSDWDIMKKAVKVLEDFSVDYDVFVSSAHRTPERTLELVKSFKGSCFIVGAGAAAHLAGVVASHTWKPVIAIPINATPLMGFDALLASVQMPSGIPVPTVAVDGSKNAAYTAIQILALSNDSMREKLISFKEEMKKNVIKKHNNLMKKLS